jgi:non-lysosomal glucosylceramidase
MFIWQIENTCDKERKVTISFVMKNGTGNKKQDAAGNPTTSLITGEEFDGVQIRQKIADMQCNYSIGICKTSDDMRISAVKKIDPNSNGSNLWKDLRENGILTEASEDKGLKDGKDVCIAICAQKSILSKATDEIEFGYVWDMPKIKFPKSERTFSKYYTKYFGCDGDAGQRILDYSFKNYGSWENLIYEEWQKDILDDK